MPSKNVFLIAFIMFLSQMSPAQKPAFTISWKKIATVPDAGNNKTSLGLAGAINGVNNDAFMVAGGSNFPDKLPWEGGKKLYYNHIFLLQKKGDDYEWNTKVTSLLPQTVAYCGVTSAPAGIVYVGGENESGILDKCFLLKWNAAKNEVVSKQLPNLPVALTNIGVTNIGDHIFAVGGDKKDTSSNTFFCLDLSEKNAEWKALPSLPLALANATVIAQKAKSGMEIFVIGGRTKTSCGISDLHHTVFAFSIKENKWRKCAGISDGVHTTNLSAASGVAIANDEILITGFDNGKTFHKIETLISKISQAKTAEDKQKLTEEKNNLSIHHKGFDKALLLYNTNGNAWMKIGELPFPAHVTTTDVMWGNKIVVSNGEIKPGVRTPEVWIGEVKSSKQ